LQINLEPIEALKDGNDLQVISREVIALQKEIDSREYRFLKKCRRAMTDGVFLNSWFTRSTIRKMLSALSAWFRKVRALQSSLLFSDFIEIQDKQQQRGAILSHFITQVQKQGVYDSLKHDRRDLVNFSKAIRARSSGKQQEYFGKFKFESLLHVFPIWLVSLPSLHRVLPLKKALFDTVIFDEATQCNLAISLPAVYRASNVVVVGDPRQLHHVSFLSRDQQEHLSGRFNMDDHLIDTNYRDNSLIDYANAAIPNQNAIVVLDEHFRSHPDLIAFSNHWFYEGQLKIMTHNPALLDEIPYEIVVCHGENKNSVNKDEAEHIVQRLSEIIQEEDKLDAAKPVSIGVLSFFRRQADYLEKKIYGHFTVNQLKRYNIRVGTPYAFQGEERDWMLLSCVVDAATPVATFTYLNREDVFNVAITRAREKQLLFLSTAVESLPEKSLLCRYLKELSAQPTGHEYVKDRKALQNEVARWLEEKGYEVYLHYLIGGVRMDMLVSDGNDSVAIDLIGFPGDDERLISIDHYKVLERAGVRIFPLSFSAWYFKRDLVKRIMGKLFSVKPKQEGIYLSELIDEKSSQILHDALDKPVVNRISALAKRLHELDLENATQQLEKGISKYTAFLQLLGQKLNRTELTYRRYKQHVEQVLFALLDNLEDIAYAELTLQPIEAEVYAAQVVLGQVDSHHDYEVEDLSQGTADKRELLEQQSKKIADLIQQNEKALTLLDEASVKLSDLKTVDGFTETSLDDAMQELQKKLDRLAAYEV
jgi:hypothetical protein